jgi:hypothetical protein
MSLAQWAFSPKPAKLKEYIAREKQLLHITLPSDKQLSEGTVTAMIAATGDHNKAQSATLISSAVLVDTGLQGVSYFFSTAATGLALGMKVTAWLPESSVRQTGFNIPESALIWYLDQICVYVKTAKQSFGRITLKDFTATPEGYFVTDGVSASDEIVVTGGQMLLSEELKNQIPDED